MELGTQLGVNYIPGRMVLPGKGRQNTFGGEIPELRPPIFEPDQTKLLLRLYLTGGTSVAVFSTLNYDTTWGTYSFWRNIGVLHDQGNTALQFVICDPALVVQEGNPTRVLDLRAIFFSGHGTDPDLLGHRRYETDEAFCGHKTGGMPHFAQSMDDLIDPVCEILLAGYFHVLQLGLWTHQDDTPRGNLPFGEYTFHLFGRPLSKGDWEFQYCWQ